MRAIWKGSISFGLVNIPVALYPAVRREELSFRMLRAKDLSPIGYKRVAEADGEEVEWEEIVKGYEYEEGKYVVLKEEDFRRVDLEAARTVNIVSFVDPDEVNPMMCYKPYHVEPDKQGDRAYVLLREALKSTGKIGVAKVVIRGREYLAAVKPGGRRLILELMYFADELVDPEELRAPQARPPGRGELEMARALIDSMTERWRPEAYTDEYRERLEEMIDRKLAGKETKKARHPAQEPDKVISLSAMLRESLNRDGAAKRKPGGKSGAGGRNGASSGKAPAKRAKKPA